MFTILVAILAASALVGVPGDMAAIPLTQGMLQSTDLPIPVSDSVRAATWETMPDKPAKPVHVRVACIVIASYGLPGACVPASSIEAGAKTVNWVKARDDYDRWERVAAPAEVALLRVVTERLNAARAPEQQIAGSVFAVRFFEEVVAPEDARAPFAAGDTLSLADVRLTKPIDGSLLSRLYPAAALRGDVSARVVIACDIQASLKLLCRDQGKVDLSATGMTSDPGRFVHDFRFSTYQFASMLQLEPTGLKGGSVAGRQLKIALVWKIPQ
jgi:hypothetical protein